MNLVLHLARAVLIVLLLFVGLLGVVAGYSRLEYWDQLATGSLVYFGLSCLAGLVLAASGAVLLFKRPAALRWVAFAAAGVLFLNQTVGIWLNTLLCFSPG